MAVCDLSALLPIAELSVNVGEAKAGREADMKGTITHHCERIKYMCNMSIVDQSVRISCGPSLSLKCCEVLMKCFLRKPAKINQETRKVAEIHGS